jgi:pyridoxal phosphate enzyme (YggS family)
MSPTSSSPELDATQPDDSQPAATQPGDGELTDRTAGGSEGRRAELVTALARVRSRLTDAAAAAGRDPREIILIAVTKTYPAADVRTLADLGVSDVGESRDQEARAKVAEVQALWAGRDSAEPAGAADRPVLRWHFVGRLQSRKARSVAGYAAAVHSVDRPELVPRLDAAVGALPSRDGEPPRNPLDVFVQVSLDGDPTRGGTPPEEVPSLAGEIAAAVHLRLCGVMAVAPIGADPDAAFARLAAVSLRLREHHPDAAMISAGMSADLESAIRNGATHVRVGSALLGRRAPLFG